MPCVTSSQVNAAIHSGDPSMASIEEAFVVYIFKYLKYAH